MKGSVALRNPVGVPIINDNSGNNITSGSPVTLDASLDQACSAVEVFNTSAKAITLTSTKTVEGVPQIRKYAVPPASFGQIIPWEMYKAGALTAQATGADATTGFLVINFLG